MKNLILTICLFSFSHFLKAADDPDCCSTAYNDREPIVDCSDYCPVPCEAEFGSWSCGCCTQSEQNSCGLCNTTQGSLHICNVRCCYCAVTEAQYLRAHEAGPAPQAMNENSDH